VRKPSCHQFPHLVFLAHQLRCASYYRGPLTIAIECRRSVDHAHGHRRREAQGGDGQVSQFSDFLAGEQSVVLAVRVLRTVQLWVHQFLLDGGPSLG
jgi:hypothetical protein